MTGSTIHPVCEIGEPRRPALVNDLVDHSAAGRPSWNSLLLVAVALSIPGCNRSADGPAAPRGAEPAQISELAAESRRTAVTAREAVIAAFEAETIELYDAIAVIESVFQAESAGEPTPAATIEALKRQIRSLALLEMKIEALYTAGKQGGEANKYAFVQLKRQLAEIALARACLAQGQPVPQRQARKSAAQAAPSTPDP